MRINLACQLLRGCGPVLCLATVNVDDDHSRERTHDNRNQNIHNQYMDEIYTQFFDGFKSRIDAKVLFQETPYLNRAEKRGFIRETNRPTVSADTIVAIPNPTIQ